MLTFRADHRTNGLSHITVEHDGQEAGGFTLPTPAFDLAAVALKASGTLYQTSHGEAIEDRPAPKKRTRRSKAKSEPAEPAQEPAAEAIGLPAE